jgi:2,3,4,5-tetrahydropyridine-2-carboxylate N-succinyltransferase
MSDHSGLRATIEAAWEGREAINAETAGAVRAAVDEALALLDRGEARAADKEGGTWTVHQWLKKAVLLSFRLNPMAAIGGGPGGATWWDKVP